MSTEPTQYSRRNFLGLLGRGMAATALTGGIVGLVSCGNSNENKSAVTPSSEPMGTLKTHIDTTGQSKPLAQQIALAELMTFKIYDAKLNPIGNADSVVAERLYRYNLDDLVDMKALSPKNEFQRGFWMPLGLGSSDKIDFYKGMNDSWNEKLRRYSKDMTSHQKEILIEERNKSLKKMKTPHKSSLRQYRSEEIAKGVMLLEELAENYLQKNYTGDSVRETEMRRLISNVEKNLSANVLLGYNIHELLPPSFGGKKINAAAKAYFVDRFLSEGGKEVIERFPARYDIMLSYGPFQLTKWAMAEISQRNLDSYVSEADKSPADMAGLNSLQDHVNAAVKFAFANWLHLGDELADNSKLKKFNDGFEKMDSREQKILLAGMTACMHHMPKDTRTGVINYLNKGSMDNMHYGIYKSLGNQLDKYYQSAAEAYLLMKVFDKLDDTYSK